MRDRIDLTLCQCGTIGQLRWDGTDGEEQWRKNPVWPFASTIQPLPQMGFHRSRQWNRPSLPTPELETKARYPAL